MNELMSIIDIALSTATLALVLVAVFNKEKK